MVVLGCTRSAQKIIHLNDKYCKGNKSKQLWQISAEEFNNVIDINIKGVTNVIHRFVPR